MDSIQETEAIIAQRGYEEGFENGFDRCKTYLDNVYELGKIDLLKHCKSTLEVGDFLSPGIYLRNIAKDYKKIKEASEVSVKEGNLSKIEKDFFNNFRRAAVFARAQKNTKADLSEFGGSCFY
jgi:hypothetical protein